MPNSRKDTSGSSASRRSSGHALQLGELCQHCGRELMVEKVDFPPSLQLKYGKDFEWYYHPCTPECEEKNDQREWELMRREARVTALRDKSGLPKRFKKYTFANFDQSVAENARNALQKVMAYSYDWEENREAGKGLYLGGGVGIGKTHLAVAVMDDLIRGKRVPSLFVTVPELLDNLRGAYNDPGRDIDEWMSAVKNAELLVLDDLGSEKATAWVQERLFVIINHRYREALPTIITSNTRPKDLAAQVGERTASRIFSMCLGIELEGADYRETAARRTR